MKIKLRPIFTLYALSVIGSGCGFVAQMLISGFWSTAFSNDVLFFSVNLAFYMLSLGLGALVSTKWKNPNLALLFEITLLLCLWTGISIAILRYAISQVGNVVYLPVFSVVVVGVLAGNIIPLTMRVGSSEPRIKLSVLFFFDYTAAIFFTLLFTFVLLIPLGYGKTALFLSFGSLAVTFLLMILSGTFSASGLALALAALVLPYPLHQSAVGKRESLDVQGESKVLIAKQSHYQKIVLTEEKVLLPFFSGSKHHVLYLDGFVQFSGTEEQAYHICIANIPAAAAEFAGRKIKKALILGGGDGLVARNLAGMNTVEKIIMVELDPEMIRLGKYEPLVRLYNRDSLRNTKVHVIVDDAFRWVKTTDEKFDLIVVDFPAPKNITLSRLFSAEFYREMFKLLENGGFVSIQSGPSFSHDDETAMVVPQVASSVKKTVESIGFKAWVYVGVQDGDAFILSTGDAGFDMEAFSRKIGITGDEGMGFICRHNPEWRFSDVEVNTLNTLVLSTYMLDWFRRAGGKFFNFRGRHAVFLPD